MTEISEVKNTVARGASSWRRLPLALLSGALLATGFPPLHWPILLPFGIALLIKTLDVESLTIRQASYLGLSAGLVFYAITLPWLFNLFGAAAISLLVIAAAFPMLFAGLFYSLRKKYTAVPTWLLAALLWTGVEYFRSEKFWLSFGWMGLGYGTIEHGMFGASASLFGSYGISFLIVAIGTALATITKRAEPNMRSIGLFTRAILALFWIFLFLLPGPEVQPNNPISVRLVQSRGGEEAESIRLSSPLEERPVDVIVWPEYSLLEDPTRSPKLWQSLQQVATNHNAYFIFGAKEDLDTPSSSTPLNAQRPNAYHNTAYVLDPTGRLIGKHYKNHTVHFVLDGVKGTDAKPIPTTLGPLGVAICFDMDYPDVARRLVQQGAEVLLVPNMDPMEWGDLQRRQHRLMFQMRAAECGRWLARADVAGGTSVAAPSGQEAERIKTADPASMDVIVGREQGKTIYVRGGWLFGPACFWTSLLLAAWPLLSRFKIKARTGEKPNK